MEYIILTVSISSTFGRSHRLSVILVIQHNVVYTSNGPNLQTVMQRINSQDERVSLRVEGSGAPERLQLAADRAARSGDLRTTVEYASGARHTIRLWSELRVWDPGD